MLVGDDGAAVAAAPLPFRPPPALTLDPSAGLIHGQQVPVSGVGLAPSTGYAVRQCLPGGRPSGEPWCDDSLAVVTSTPEGTFSVSVPLSTRMSGPALGPVHCRSQSALSVWTPEGWLPAPFAMAEGFVAATPTAGLADGATVHVAGHDMQPTYTVIPIGPFPTGAASVGRCAAGTAEDPNLCTPWTAARPRAS